MTFVSNRKNKFVLSAMYLLLIVAFQFLYFEWGGIHQAFLWEMMGEVFQKQHLVENLLHPIILSSLIGLIVLIVCAIHPPQRRWMKLLTIAPCGILVLLMLVIGLLSSNFKIVVFALPYILLSLMLLLRKTG